MPAFRPFEVRDEQTVVTSRVAVLQRAGGVPPLSVRFQPFPAVIRGLVFFEVDSDHEGVSILRFGPGYWDMRTTSTPAGGLNVKN